MIFVFYTSLACLTWIFKKILWNEPVFLTCRMVVVVPPERHPVLSGIRQSAYYPGNLDLKACATTCFLPGISRGCGFSCFGSRRKKYSLVPSY
jgi:hypothetical protein